MVGGSGDGVISEETVVGRGDGIIMGVMVMVYNNGGGVTRHGRVRWRFTFVLPSLPSFPSVLHFLSFLNFVP
jgi:hypothetical protein